MEQHGERFGPRPGQEAQVPASGEVGGAEEAEAWDLEDDAAVVAWDGQEDADVEASDAADAVTWDAGEAADVDAWDAGPEADAVEWQAGESAGGAIPVPGAPGRRAETGEARVDAALARLAELDGRPVTEHRAIFEDVHRRLRDVLGELDSREPDQAPAAGAERRAGR